MCPGVLDWGGGCMCPDVLDWGGVTWVLMFWTGEGGGG